jgi:uncharacterized membrane protein
MLKGGTGDRLWTTIMSLAVALVGAAAIPFLSPLAPASWPYVVASGVLHVGYNVLLVKTYDSGDFSETYPIARGSSPMLIAMSAAVFAGERPGVPPTLGIALVCGGIVSLGLKGKGLRIASLSAALTTGSFIATYSVVDGTGVRAAGDTLAYVAWMTVLEGGPMAVVFVFLRGGLRAGVAATLDQSARRFAVAILGGWLSLIAYGVVIWAMHHGPSIRRQSPHRAAADRSDTPSDRDAPRDMHSADRSRHQRLRQSRGDGYERRFPLTPAFTSIFAIPDFSTFATISGHSGADLMRWLVWTW